MLLTPSPTQPIQTPGKPSSGAATGALHGAIPGLAQIAKLAQITVLAAAGFTQSASFATPAASASATAGTEPGPLQLRACRLQGVDVAALCGVLRRPLNAAKPAEKHIDIHFAVIPALARNKQPDPIVLFAGGPGQSAINLAAFADSQFARLKTRRDIVLIDQRGTGRSMGLDCPSRSRASLAEDADLSRTAQRMGECRAELRGRHGLRDEHFTHFTTVEASADVEAVRAALGYPQINLVGASYGTRAAMDYQRQFPKRVRRAVLDGVAPSDMVLPATVSADAQRALDALLAGCAQTPQCQRAYPQLQAHWQQLLAKLPQTTGMVNPRTLQNETLVVTQDLVMGAVRGPLYVPSLASALPFAIEEAHSGRFGPLFGLGQGLSSPQTSIAWGMHFSVICAEDLPRVAQTTEKAGAQFGDALAGIYKDVCADWPQAAVPAAFYTLPPASQPTLLLSGGQDPVTPPRHGARAAAALGAMARHVVVDQLGHGVMSAGCATDMVYRFINTPDDASALSQLDPSCLAKVPRPSAFVLPSGQPRAPASGALGTISATSAIRRAPDARTGMPTAFRTATPTAQQVRP